MIWRKETVKILLEELVSVVRAIVDVNGCGSPNWKKNEFEFLIERLKEFVHKAYYTAQRGFP